MRTKLLVSATILLLAFSAGMYFAISTSGMRTTPNITGLLWPEPPILQPFALVDMDGNPYTEQQLQGHWTLIFFGFTNCPDICPTTMNTLSQVYQRLRGNAALFEKMQVLFVSVDPERDDNETLRAYVDYFNSAFVGATADDENLSQFTRQLGVMYMKAEAPGVEGYSVDHSASILLIDPEMRFVGVFSPPHTANGITERLTQIVTYLESTGS